MQASEDLVKGTGEWLIATRRSMDGAEAQWLDGLARFDREQRWADEGWSSCVEWLVARAGMSRPVAYERVRVARELVRRPVVAAALAEGRVSWCAVRAITRAEGASAEVDAALVDVAEGGTVADVERTVRLYQQYQDQDRPPTDAERTAGRGMRLRELPGGMVRIEVIVSASEAAEVDAAIRTVLTPPDPVSAPDEAPAPRADEVVPGAGESGWAEQRADALLDVLRAGSVVTRPVGGGADRYLVHYVTRDGATTLVGGRVPTPAEAARVACDCSLVGHHQDERGVPLHLGRRTRVWSSAQRRAVLVRDGGHCRFPGCRRTTVDIHHLIPWEEGGATDVGNGLALCARHHTLVHDGYVAIGDANGTLEWFSPALARLGVSRVAGPLLRRAS